MESKVASDERLGFSDRLKSSLQAAEVSTSASEFTRAYNARADGAAVSVHAARKWLVGESIPTHEKVVILSVWLGVSPAWLRFGDPSATLNVGAVIPEADIGTPALSLLNDIMSLPEPARKTIRGIVDAFLRNFGSPEKDGGAP